MRRRRDRGRAPSRDSAATRRSLAEGREGAPSAGGSRGDLSPARVGLVVAGLTLLAAALHALGHSQRPLTLDEACTYWTVQARALDVLAGARTDGTPPLHFLIVSLVTGLLGSSEMALRLPSLVAATALVPAAWAVTRLFATIRAALIAAALAAISPLVHYYSVEARSYALVQLETLGIVYAARRAALAPGELRWWALLSLAQAVQLWTHNYALFLLPVPPLIFLALGGQRRVALAAKAAAASLLAFAVYIPCFLNAQQNATAGVGDWIVSFWEETPPYAAIVRSLEVFGFGGRYPWYLPSLFAAPAVRVVSVPLTLVLLVVAAVLPRRGRSPGSGDRSSHLTLLGFLLLPLAAAWLYSYLRDPVYLVGRYDTMVLPVFLVIVAIALDGILSARRVVGWLTAGTVVGFGVVALATTQAQSVPDGEDVLAARYLAAAAAPADRIVSTGMRRAIVVYYLDRAGRHAELSSFPPEIDGHPGWYSADRLLRDRDRLAGEGERLASDLATAAAGRSLWILSSPPNDVDRYFFRPLLRHFTIDEARSRRQWGVICLTHQ